ncbi:hypothetical protein JQ604_33100 [Bradyrhizobium jicamae]|uniref:hypothetical protein n=1 Tax=Bradyrhizobium jicamae TaxID=280332 RepID=UPI001BA69AB5|nr:hypothetical protein [Bradyrhizobium jicamae]MBR0757046.1 hypothetical protein [Bradyrhizobium jicamae]
MTKKSLSEQALEFAEGARPDARRAIETLAAELPTGPAEKPKSGLTLLLACTTIFLLYLPIALWVHKDYAHVREPNGAQIERLLKFESIGGFGYRSQIFTMSQHVDDDDNSQTTPVIVYEGDKPLGPNHSSYTELKTVGRGRSMFVNDRRNSEWKVSKYIFFSTSDNSDPRTNGRLYWAVVPRQ